MSKRGSRSLTVLTLMIWGALATAEPPTLMASEQEFLEFLGGWELEDGTWVNPLDFLEPDEDQITDDAVKERSSFKKFNEADHDKPTPTHIPEPTTQP